MFYKTFEREKLTEVKQVELQNSFTKIFLASSVNALVTHKLDFKSPSDGSEHNTHSRFATWLIAANICKRDAKHSVHKVLFNTLLFKQQKNTAN